MRPRTALLVMATVLLCGNASAQEVDAASRAAARQLALDGIDALGKGDYPKADGDLERAYSVLKVPSIGLWSARSLAKLGRFVAASERYREVIQLPLPSISIEVHRAAQADAQAELTALLPRLGHLAIVVPPALDATVTVDGRAVPAAILGTELPVDPGARHIELRSGSRVAERDLVVHEGETLRTELALPPNIDVSSPPSAPTTPVAVAPAPAPAPFAAPAPAHQRRAWRTATWVTLGVGAAGIVFGAVTGGVAANENSTLNTVCFNNVCPSSSSASVSTYRTNRDLSIAGFWAGGGVLAIGGALLLVAPRDHNDASVSAWIGPHGLGLVGAF